MNIIKNVPESRNRRIDSKKSIFSIDPIASYSVIKQFRQAMQSFGIFFSGEIIANGELHRFYIEGHKRGSLNGAYTLHFDGCPAGYFQDFKTGISQTWNGSSEPRVSPVLIRQIKQAKLHREIEMLQKNIEAAKKANYIWKQSKPANKQSEHSYLISKRIQPHGTRLYHNALVIPIYNESDQLINLQFISREGEKRFLSAGKKRGCFHIISDVTKRILICEGFATGASLYEGSRQQVIVAFDAGNLLAVAKNIHGFFPNKEIIICGDNDKSGVGQDKAREAALKIGGKILIPLIPGQDWNDCLKGDYQHG